MYVHLQPTPGRHRRVLAGQLVHQHPRIEHAVLGLQTAAIQARDIQQAIEQFFGTTQRGIDALDQMPLLRVVGRVLAQGRSKQPRGIERLQHVMADGGQKARTRGLRLLGRA